MVALLCFFLTLFALPFKSRRRLEVENLFLRHQLNIALRRRLPRPRLRGSDRALLALMTRLWHPHRSILMEQENRTRPHLERVLLLAGMRDAGKSRLLRSMFVDPRLGHRILPTKAKIKLVALSRERCLLVRCMSPHESPRRETLEEFIGNLDHNMQRAWNRFRSFNFACAVQPRATDRMPDLVEICTALIAQLMPERIRVVQIHPRQDERPGDLLEIGEIDRLRLIGVEICTIDGRRPRMERHHPNGLLLADFFDFT